VTVGFPRVERGARGTRELSCRKEFGGSTDQALVRPVVVAVAERLQRALHEAVGRTANSSG
jgi:hypothetical protein